MELHEPKFSNNYKVQIYNFYQLLSDNITLDLLYIVPLVVLGLVLGVTIFFFLDFVIVVLLIGGVSYLSKGAVGLWSYNKFIYPFLQFFNYI